MNTANTGNGQDAQARDQIESELRRYHDSLLPIGIPDRRAFLAESKRHLDNMDGIKSEHAHRHPTPRHSGSGPAA